MQMYQLRLHSPELRRMCKEKKEYHMQQAAYGIEKCSSYLACEVLSTESSPSHTGPIYFPPSRFFAAAAALALALASALSPGRASPSEPRGRRPLMRRW